MPDYITVVYDEGKRPYTDYPEKLCHYLFSAFKMSPGMKFLETGCGRGEHLRHFKNLGLQVTGIDLAQSTAQFSPDLDIKICDVEKEGISFPDSSFDIVYSKSFIEHLYYPEKFVKEAFRVLKPGGIFLTLVPDWEANYKIYFDDYSHRTPFTNYALEDIYKIYGFSEINVYKFRQLPIVWKYPVLNYFCAAISSFIPVRTKNKFLRWSRELMLIGFGKK
ncbi:MAG: class I SAM-dependent methyltransferase [Endomicrobiales bacterium]|nr:class I SAM-dependent methyltransferase [Endomicrobiales bacterium]